MKTLVPSLWLSLLAFLFLITGCDDSKKRDKKSGFNLIKQEAVFFTRAYSRDSGVLSFELRAPAFCKIDYWPIGTDNAQISNSQKTQECNNSRAKQKQDVRISGLDTNALYVFKIYVWANTQAGGEVFIAKESPVDIYQPVPEPFGELIIVRSDLPLKTASLHRYSYKTEQEAIDFSKSQARKTGCVQGNIDQSLKNFFSEPTANLKIENISSRGFATANATSHPFNLDSKLLSFETLQFGDRWEWTYDLGASSFRVFSKQVNKFENLSLSTSQSYPLKEQNLRSKRSIVNYLPGQDISINWQTLKPAETEQVLAFIIASEASKSIFCVFNASDGKGLIDRQILSNLDKQSHQVTIYLEDRQLLSVEGGSSHSWFIQSYDWRSLILDKT